MTTALDILLEDNYELVHVDQFDAGVLDESLWLPAHLPQWSSRAQAAARYALVGDTLELLIEEDQSPWCPEFDGQTRVSSLQTGVFGAAPGTSRGQHRFNPEAVVREPHDPTWLYTPTYGVFQLRAKALLDPTTMVALWMIGIEDVPERSAVVDVMEVFGKNVTADGAGIGMNLQAFTDPAITDDAANVELPIDVAEFHSYTLQWTPDHLAFFVDQASRSGPSTSPPTTRCSSCSAEVWSMLWPRRGPSTSSTNRTRRGPPHGPYPKRFVNVIDSFTAWEPRSSQDDSIGRDRCGGVPGRPARPSGLMTPSSRSDPGRACGDGGQWVGADGRRRLDCSVGMMRPMADPEHDIILLDGGMGQELVARGVAGSKTLWSAAALLDAPDQVLAVHTDFITAGADVITTNSYAAGRDRLEKAGVGDLFQQLNRRSGELAAQARDQADRPVRIAGSLGPLRGTFAPDNVATVEELIPLYTEQAELLTPYVDLLLCETMSTADEALAAATAATSTGLDVWVSWTLAEDGTPGELRDGTAISDAIAALDRLPVRAFLANCAMPERITAAMPALVTAGGLAGGFANGFVPIPEGWVVTDGLPDARDDLGVDAYARHAKNWVDHGARIVGGCCEVGPAHIAGLRRSIEESTNRTES